MAMARYIDLLHLHECLPVPSAGKHCGGQGWCRADKAAARSHWLVGATPPCDGAETNKHSAATGALLLAVALALARPRLPLSAALLKGAVALRALELSCNSILKSGRVRRALCDAIIDDSDER
ncbi:hypothetical protein PMIN02_011283 [Paraphaeosphaeria minitans]